MIIRHNSAVAAGGTALLFALAVLTVPSRSMAQSDPPVDETEPATRSDREQPNSDGGPTDPDAVAAVRRVEHRLERGDHGGAWELLRSIFRRPQFSTVPGSNGSFVPTHRQATLLLRRLPEEYHDRYRREFGPTARRLVRQAVESCDPEALSRIATRFADTDGGRNATRMLIARHLDRGEVTLAMHWLRILMESDSDGQPTASQLELARAVAAVAEHAGIRVPDTIAKKFAADAKLSAISQSVVDDMDVAAWGRSAIDSDWHMLHGRPDRCGVAPDCRPVPLIRWSAGSTDSSAVAARIRDVTDWLRDQHQPMIPAFSAVTAGNRIAFRTMRGVQVVDATTGRRLWETRPHLSPEEIILANGDSRSAVYEEGFGPGRFRLVRRFFGSADANNDNLAALLFRDGVYGMISCDDERVYVIEDKAIHPQPGSTFHADNDPSRNDPLRRDWSTNRLVAWDLATGRRRWEVGGSGRGDTFSNELDNCYFHGVPVVDGDELYVVAERDQEIRLVALDVESGRQNWTCLIAWSDVQIERDLVRRFWPAQIAVREGILICPTTVGWLAAVDQRGRSLLWAVRYSDDELSPRRITEDSRAHLKPLAGRWVAGAPVISGQRILVAPSESGVLECRSLMDGTLLWKRPRQTLLALTGVVNQRVVLTGRGSVVALSTADGQPVWRYQIPASLGRLAGRGLLTEHHLHQSLTSGRLLTLDLDDGRPTIGAPPGRNAPGVDGNLIHSQGQILAVSPHGLTAFELDDAVRARLAGLDSRQSGSPHAALLAAELGLALGDTETAVEILDTVRVDNVSADIRRELQTRRRAALEVIARRDPGSAGDVINRIEQLADTVQSSRVAIQLAIAGMLDRSEDRQALDRLQSANDALLGGTLRRLDDPNIAVSTLAWAGGRIVDLKRDATGPVKQQIEQLFERSIDHRTGATAGDLQAFAHVPATYIGSANARRILAANQTVLTSESACVAELVIHRLTAHPDPHVAAAAMEQLALHLRRNGARNDAQAVEAMLLRRIADMNTTQSEPLRRRIDERRRDDDRPGGAASTWSASNAGPWTVTRLGTDSSAERNSTDLIAGRFRNDFFDRHRCDLLSGQWSLRFTDAATNTVEWLVPLHNERNAPTRNVRVGKIGNLLLVLHDEHLSALATADRKILWSRGLPPLDLAPAPDRRMQSADSFRFLKGRRFLAAGGIDARNQPREPLPIVNQDYVAVRGRRSLLVLDSVTGNTRWQLDGIPAGARVSGTTDHVFLRDSSGTRALRSLDGQSFEVNNSADMLLQAVAAVNDALVVLIPPGFLERNGAEWKLAAINPITLQEYWSHTCDGDSQFVPLDDRNLAVLTGEGLLEIVSLLSGRVVTGNFSVFGGGPKPHRTSVLTDATRLFLMLHYDDGLLIGQSVPSVPANGRLIAVDRQTGEQLWEKSVENQSLIADHFRHQPLLLFVSRRYEAAGGRGIWTVRLLGLDRSTGAKLVSAEWPSAFRGDVHAVRLNSADQYVELVSHNQRVRIQPARR